MQLELAYRGACPEAFEHRCREAARGGKGRGYKLAGYTLAGLVPTVIDADSVEERATKLDELSRLIWRWSDGANAGPTPDDEGVLAWFDCELPRCMSLVPKSGRRQFLRGVYAYVIQDGRHGAYSH